MTVDDMTPTPLDIDPYRRGAAFAALRRSGEVTAFPQLDQVLAAVSYRAVEAGLRLVEDFGGSAGQDDLEEVDQNIAALDEPRHGQVRRIINSVIAFHKSQKIEPYLVELTQRLVGRMLDEARMSDSGAVDVMAYLAGPVPPAAMAKLFGFPEADSTQYYGWIHQAGANFQRAAAEGQTISIAQGSPGLAGYVDDQIQDRLAMAAEEWPHDALTRFLVAEVEGGRLDVRSIRAQIMFMIGAGTETTRNAIGSLIYRLGLDPAAYEQVRHDPALVDSAIEEALRMDAPAQWMVRTCQRPTELAGTAVPAGKKVFMCIGSGNHDETVFDRPDEFRLDRDDRNHLTFGSGPHICPGAPLARLEIRTAMKAFTERVDSYHLADGEHFDAMPTAMLQGLKSLNIVIDREVTT